MTPEELSELEKQFDADTDELLNKICDTFHDELKSVAEKWGSIIISLNLKIIEEFKE
jgi:hypothetical protein